MEFVINNINFQIFLIIPVLYSLHSDGQESILMITTVAHHKQFMLLNKIETNIISINYMDK
jgi:hypothetical protein